jgi:uncharacterized protein (TIGR04222 family)
MWPFNLPGPAFLLFYVLFALGSVILFYILQSRREAGSGDAKSASRRMSDPYALAYLRGGDHEAIRVAIVSLVDRKLLTEDDGKLNTPINSRVSMVRRPIEKAVMTACMVKPLTVDVIMADAKVKASCEELEHDLQQKGLRASSETMQERRPLFWAFFGALGFVAGVKVVAAMMSGRTNVLFLIAVAVIFLFWIYRISRRQVTGLGKAVMRDMRSLFSGLKSRASTIKSGGGSTEAVMLAAVFGVAALPAAEFPYVKRLFPHATDASGGDGSSSSGCGSSGGDSGGSSCGGGGGCGGCGG